MVIPIMITLTILLLIVYAIWHSSFRVPKKRYRIRIEKHPDEDYTRYYSEFYKETELLIGTSFEWINIGWDYTYNNKFYITQEDAQKSIDEHKLKNTNYTEKTIYLK